MKEDFFIRFKKSNLVFIAFEIKPNNIMEKLTLI